MIFLMCFGGRFYIVKVSYIVIYFYLYFIKDIDSFVKIYIIIVILFFFRVKFFFLILFLFFGFFINFFLV